MLRYEDLVYLYVMTYSEFCYLISELLKKKSDM